MQLPRISFSSRAVVEDPFKWAYTLEDHGYTGWEIVQEGSQCLSSKTVQNLKNIYETTNLELTLHLPFSDMNLAGLNDSIRAEVLRQMKNYLTLASNYVSLAVVHPGYLSPYGAQVPDQAYMTNLASIRELCDFAADFGIIIAVENMPDFPKIFGKYPDEMQEMLDAIGSHNVGFTFDVGHANTVGLIDEFLDQLNDRISHVHIHDNMGKKDEHLPLGEGNIDWKHVMGKLSNYKGIFVTEMSSVEEGIKSLEFLRKL
ncbi:Sugar phosphate isomerase/epimerase [Methanosarcina siciliae C2J]|uniref:Sugar phosphate isomerase/epimerase n=3 Tax=Methanosarcina siciliae TaxID=38027 RepID=A0A0E3P9L4_9EURY|nr:sugar phosphate isomerase/epimerase family protein [Methanosarcina siciliae]AKB26723.1 Sugar phosphate isomerase/epimerase [Methanosarcina siciliae T4/M]AKB30694.1 Sugar phosphate isomerase/epimerase [Methanosarcina siciliae HI350]AKB34594.1 Sugar phosphate isomerase/epimerase [Methanosarcina siciliae C2J]